MKGYNDDYLMYKDEEYELQPNCGLSSKIVIEVPETRIDDAEKILSHLNTEISYFTPHVHGLVDFISDDEIWVTLDGEDSFWEEDHQLLENNLIKVAKEFGFNARVD